MERDDQDVSVESEAPFRRSRMRGALWGMRYEVESCPDSSRTETLKIAGGMGLGVYGVSWLLGCSLPGRLIGAAAGAFVGALASRYHVFLDWDPDRARKGELFEEPDQGH